MKIRTDFVSNSSSSSFVVWGMKLDREPILKNFLEPGQDPDDYSWEAIDEFVRNLNTESDYSFSWVSSGYNEEQVIVGVKPDYMHEDETLAQFKSNIRNIMSKHLPECADTEIRYVQGIDSDGDFCED